jgi:ABC-2 type transport system ATP-binding protein
VIQIEHLTKGFGPLTAVDNLSVTVEPGRVTGLLGPNGAGKTTAISTVLGLQRPTSGRALVAGRPYGSFDRPLHQVGALLDAGAVHSGRTARAHLTWVAQSNKIATKRIDDLLRVVGLEPVADRRVRTYSLGMKQRLGIAQALLGDAPVMMFDEPTNGLDPEGIEWLRGFLKQLAHDGRTVLVSSHLMGEMSLTADHLIVIGRGRLLADKVWRSRGSRPGLSGRSPRRPVGRTSLAHGCWFLASNGRVRHFLNRPGNCLIRPVLSMSDIVIMCASALP